MKRHNVTLSEPLSEMVQAQVKTGRYKDFSAAMISGALSAFSFSPWSDAFAPAQLFSAACFLCGVPAQWFHS